MKGWEPRWSRLWLDAEEDGSVFDRLGVPDTDLADDALYIGLELVHELHRLQDAQGLTLRDTAAHLDVDRGFRRRCPVECPDHRALHLDEVRSRGRRCGGRGRSRRL